MICLTGCLASRTSQRIVEGKPQQARAHLDELVQAFGAEDVYFEVQRNGLAEQEQVNEAIARFAPRWAARWSRRRTSTTSAARTTTTTPRCCACRRSRRSPQPKMSFETNEFFLKSSEEMAEAFADMPDAVASTLEIAERCDVEIELGKQLIPRFDCPDGKSERSTCASWSDAACAAATATRRPPRPSSGWRWSSGSSTTWASTPTS